MLHCLIFVLSLLSEFVPRVSVILYGSILNTLVLNCHGNVRSNQPSSAAMLATEGVNASLFEFTIILTTILIINNNNNALISSPLGIEYRTHLKKV